MKHSETITHYAQILIDGGMEEQEAQTEEKPAEPTKQTSRRRRAAKPTMADAEKSVEKPSDKSQEQPAENIIAKDENVVVEVKPAEEKSAQTKPQKSAAKRALRRKTAPKSESVADADKSKEKKGAAEKKSTADNEQKELF